MRCRIYRNLHRSCWSIQACATGRVIAHRMLMVMSDVTFVVRPAGRKQVLATGRKTVHAFAVGTLAEDTDTSPLLMVEVTYNPYRNETFIRKDSGEPVTHAKVVLFTPECRVFAQL